MASETALLMRLHQLFATDRDSPADERDAQSPGGGKIRVFENGRVLCEGVVVDDGGLLVV